MDGNMVSTPKVSVSMVTYNHERYIAQAIEGVLMQQAPFAYELVIADDCSTDRTPSIVQDYARRHSGVIRPLLTDRNLGASANSERTLMACRGEYLTVCDGDDYWTDSGKLAKQAAFLDSHPDYNMCFHDCQQVLQQGDRQTPIGRLYGFRDPPTPATMHRRHLLQGFVILQQTAMMRNCFRAGLPSFVLGVANGDWVLNLIAAGRGRIHYRNEAMSVYRMHTAGTWAGAAWRSRTQTMLGTAYAIRDYFDLSFRERVTLESFIMRRHLDCIRTPGLRETGMTPLRYVRQVAACRRNVSLAAALGLLLVAVNWGITRRLASTRRRAARNLTS